MIWKINNDKVSINQFNTIANIACKNDDLKSHVSIHSDNSVVTLKTHNNKVINIKGKRAF